MYPTDLTVAAVVRHADKYLMVEETATGRRVFSQPGGHIETGEGPEQAVVREVFEETGCRVDCGGLIGVYLWIQPQTRQQFLRIVFEARYVDCDPTAELDAGVIARRWLSRADVEQKRTRLRSPTVLRCIEDFEAGMRQSHRLLSGMLPLHRNVAAVLAAADLV